MFKFVHYAAQITMTNVTQSQQEFSVNYWHSVLMIYFGFNFDSFLFVPLSSPSLALTNLQMNQITCVSKCSLLNIQTESGNILNTSFSDITMLAEGMLVEVASASFRNTLIDDLSATNVQA